ncbi:putative transmembrane protein [Rhodopirellula islandica]|uniref:Transmembrane protein n=1 Tax=Rhodopirellula islandica TaxID=595434 RepID=A0A0J1B4T9_RHOIS|nr:type II secretion system protein [Rhodopirellula islandica]KLU01638.1 putative transmembrane protein [Rhodopirellula islandica]
MNHRHGFTLIETLVTLALVIAMLGGTLGLVSLMRTSSQHATTAALDRQEIRRLANDIRRDVADANQVEVEGAQLILDFSDSDSRIVYDFGSEPAFARTVESTAQSINDSLIASDRYLISERSQVQLQLQLLSEDDADSDREASLVELTVALPDRPTEPIQILAAPRMSP